ncbi:uncharacterized protein LOC141827581 [Curcuma longa]|uniref:uncharacterized protein LOC141827581 n=1 Tax=Curcuma longa TaxID=136217 RepID=UPI003D9E4A4A
MLRFLVRRHAFPPPSQLCRIFFCTGTSASSSGAAASPDPHFMVEYLVSTCGFSVDAASKVSKSLPRIQSTENPDVVLGFLRSQGLDGANLRKVISWRPGLLGWDVETNLAPKFQFLRDMGLSESDIIDVVLLHPTIIGLNFQNTLLPRLKVWESLFGSKEILVKNLRRCGWFLSSNIENVVRPNTNFLRDECGIPEEQLSLVIRRHPCFIVQNPESLRALVDRAEGIGIPRGSGMFHWILDVLHRVSREKFEAHVKLMNSFGWSNSEFVAAIKKYPTFLWLSTEALQRKMKFFINNVGSTPSDIAKHPVVLQFSLEKRLIPRFHVMEILKSEGLWTSRDKLHTFFSSPGPKFLQKYVHPHKDKLPKLLEVL